MFGNLRPLVNCAYLQTQDMLCRKLWMDIFLNILNKRGLCVSKHFEQIPLAPPPEGAAAPEGEGMFFNMLGKMCFETNTYKLYEIYVLKL